MSEVQGDDRLEEDTAPPAGEEAPEPATSSVEVGVEVSAEAGGDSASTVASTETAEAPARKPRASRPAAGTGRTRRTSKAATAADETAVEEVAVPVPAAPSGPPRLLQQYRSEVVPAMIQEFGYQNVTQVPRLKKVVLNIGLGEALTNPRAMETAVRDLSTISGQKPIITRARKSIANFKLREGNPIGMCVTLRGIRMYQFMDRLLNAALPRIRDFRGVSSTSFDGRGNYSLGIREQIIFPEIDYGQIERIRGLQVTINTSANTDAEATRLLALLGMPFARQN